MNTALEQIKERALIKTAWMVERKEGLPVVLSPLLKKYPALVHAFTTRQGGHSKPPYDSFNIGINQTTDEEARKDARLNRAQLCQSLHVPFDHLITASKLIHSADITMLETTPAPGELDGIATRTIGKPIYMTFADCVPVLIYDPVQHIFCLVHAGWRGTASAISRKAVEVLVKEYGSRAGNLVCAVGPAIGACCYAVGLEVVSGLTSTLVEGIEPDQINKMENDAAWAFLQKMNLAGFFNYDQKQIYTNLKAINAYQLLAAGVSLVDVTDFCTSCREDLFYSYRRSYVKNEGNTGRQAALACLA